MGVLGGIPATTENLLHQSKQLPPNSNWQVIGIGRKQWALIAAAITLGGNIRAGLDPNTYLDEETTAAECHYGPEDLKFIHEEAAHAIAACDTHGRQIIED